MTSSLLPLMMMLFSAAGPRAESSVRLRVRFTHSSWMLSFASVTGVYDDATGPGTNKKVDDICSCADDEETVVACVYVKDGGGSRAPSPTAASPSTDDRLSGRSCSHRVGEQERERLRIVRNEGRYKSTSMVSAE